MQAQIEQMIERGALFVVNHSGGKDSQATLLEIRKYVPAQQIVVIHARLPGVDWPDIETHIHQTSFGLPFLVCSAVKTFFEMVERRGRWPSPQQRQCTSDLKRGPIEREIRHFLKSHPQFKGLVVSCTGIRAEESAGRAGQQPLRISKRNSVGGREWHDWLPIHDWTARQVFAAIADAGQQPHWAYAAGMSRLSCCFCIMSSKADLQVAARLQPDLYAQYVKTEKRLGASMLMPKKGQSAYLEDVTGIVALPAKAAA